MSADCPFSFPEDQRTVLLCLFFFLFSFFGMVDVVCRPCACTPSGTPLVEDLSWLPGVLVTPPGTALVAEGLLTQGQSFPGDLYPGTDPCAVIKSCLLSPTGSFLKGQFSSRSLRMGLTIIKLKHSSTFPSFPC